jgi:DNA helicase-2/ATP-dependent DNA helicase PcrA
VHDPAAGSELVRLLSGARYRVGTRDLAALADVARWLAAHDWAQKALSADLRDKLRASVAGDEGSSLVDALDFLATAPDSHGQFALFSELGRTRVQSAGRQLAWLRSRAGLPLLDFVRLIEQEFRLDIELTANESNDLGLANLYSFHDTVGAFLDSDEQGTLASFLRWLKRAEQQDDLGPRAELSEQGTVQLLTIHGAKGLEWDFVAIPNLTEKSVPAAARDTSGWLRFGELPYSCRGDRLELPELEVSGHDTQLDYDLTYQTFKAELAARHDDEERRLIYVATTRAKGELLLTGSFWGPGLTVRRPSRYLTELATAGLVPAIPVASVEIDKPTSAADDTESWPFDPLGRRRALVEAAAARVWSSEADAPTRWSHAVTLLLQERALRLAGGGVAPVPARIPASRFKDYVDDPAAVAAELRRPMPQRPYRATRLGTLFHSWVERRAGRATGTDQIDSGLNELDFGDDPGEDSGGAGTLSDLAVPDQERFAQLQATFERSEWADRAPVDVEIEIHHVLGGQVFVCKLDAVYRTETGYQVVDWKTGRAPKNAADLELKQTQLALYRLAYARFKGIDPSSVDAVFYFVADDTVIKPERLYSETDLLEAWSGAMTPVRDASATSEPSSAPASRAEKESSTESSSSESASSESTVSPEKL